MFYMFKQRNLFSLCKHSFWYKKVCKFHKTFFLYVSTTTPPISCPSLFVSSPLLLPSMERLHGSLQDKRLTLRWKWQAWRLGKATTSGWIPCSFVLCFVFWKKKCFDQNNFAFMNCLVFIINLGLILKVF